MRPIILPIAIAALLCLTGCGAGSLGAKGAVLLQEHYPDGQLMQQGWARPDAAGTLIRDGAWTTWYDNGQVRWQGSYMAGEIDRSRAWREWNPEGSVRDDSGDASVAAY